MSCRLVADKPSLMVEAFSGDSLDRDSSAHLNFSAMRMSAIHVKRILKFQLVAWIGTLVNLGALWLLKGKFGIPLAAAGACAIELAIIHNFTWYYFLTWRERVARTARDYLVRLAKYNVVTAAIDFVCNLSLLMVLTSYVGLHYLVANILGMLAGPVLKYFVNEYLIFRQKSNLDEHIRRGGPYG